MTLIKQFIMFASCLLEYKLINLKEVNKHRIVIYQVGQSHLCTMNGHQTNELFINFHLFF